MAFYQDLAGYRFRRLSIGLIQLRTNPDKLECINARTSLSAPINNTLAHIHRDVRSCRGLGLRRLLILAPCQFLQVSAAGSWRQTLRQRIIIRMILKLIYSFFPCL